MIAQVFQAQEVLQGYAHKDDTTFFLLSEKQYTISQVSRVVLTGSFRNWSQDMDDPGWQLKPLGDGLWMLALANPNYENIPPQAEFKFRIDDGKWLDPPTMAPNAKGGNFIFLSNVISPQIKAEIIGEKAIWAYIDGLERPLDPQAYRLLNA
ncbi:MAG: pullulanase, partial [Bacteroidota bacterium]